MRRMSQRHEITVLFSNFRIMSEFYDDEKQAFRSLLAQYGIYLTRTKIEGTAYEPDGNILYKIFCTTFAEVKNDVGCTGAEPYLQSCLYYLEWTRQYAPLKPRSVLPCIFIIVCGPYIGFAGAGWNVRPNAQVLSATIPFHFRHSDTKLRTMAARHFDAFQKAIHSLEEYYR